MERTEMVYPSPRAPQAKVRAGVMEMTVASGDEPWKADSAKTVRRPLYIHTTRVMRHRLAEELGSRAHTVVSAAEAAGS